VKKLTKTKAKRQTKPTKLKDIKKNISKMLEPKKLESISKTFFEFAEIFGRIGDILKELGKKETLEATSNKQPKRHKKVLSKKERR
jgi:uncharacterized protein YjgD (DUF1641 family)